MVWDGQKQYTTSNGRGLLSEYGEISFSTEDLTVEVATGLAKVISVFITPKVTMGINTEQFFCDLTITDGAVTVTREIQPIYISGVASTDYITSNNYVEAPIGTCPVAGTLVQAVYYNDIIAGGSPLIEIGKIATNGTGAADIDFFHEDGLSIACPASSVGKVITAFSSDVVAADDMITFGTTGGTTTDPQGGFLQVKITPTVISALTFTYIFMGY